MHIIRENQKQQEDLAKQVNVFLGKYCTYTVSNLMHHAGSKDLVLVEGDSLLQYLECF